MLVVFQKVDSRNFAPNAQRYAQLKVQGPSREAITEENRSTSIPRYGHRLWDSLIIRFVCVFAPRMLLEAVLSIFSASNNHRVSTFHHNGHLCPIFLENRPRFWPGLELQLDASTARWQILLTCWLAWTIFDYRIC
jgi:hypothetical protein